MKKIILFAILLCSMNAFSQRVDTVNVSLTLRAQDWAYLVGSTGLPKDSAMQKSYRRVRDKIQSNIPANWTTVVTVDSLSGPYVMRLYRTVIAADAGVIENRYTAIKNAITAKLNLATWIAQITAIQDADFINRRTEGKNQIIDQ